MIKNTIRISLSTLIFCASMSHLLFAQTYNDRGSYLLNLRNKNINIIQIQNQLNTLLGIDNSFHFEKIKEKTDFIGMKHEMYQQSYRGINISGASVIVHSKDGFVTAINAKILSEIDDQINTIAVVSSDEAVAISKKVMNAVSITSFTTVEQAISLDNHYPRLTYEVNLDGVDYRGLVIKHKVVIDALNGDVIKKIPLIAHIDVEATAHTLFSGIQTITTDMVSDGVYRLRDNTRNIETYDVGGQIPEFSGTTMFPTPNDLVNSTTNWLPRPHIMSTSLSTIIDPTLLEDIELSFTTYTGKVFSSVVVRDSDLAILARNIDIGIDGPITLPYYSTNLFLSTDADETYTGRFYRDSVYFDTESGTLESAFIDEVSSASFPIIVDAVGTFEWVDEKGNTGTYTIEDKIHPALDVHWGISRTWDFYNNNYDYQSYDGEGSLMKNYYNGTSILVGSQNNAAALPAPENSMVYGTGDGIDFNPFVALDVTAHEYSHLVTGNNANLEYSGESGALNESFSDIIGAAVEYFAKPTEANWTIGEEICITTPFFRSMADPNAPALFGSDFSFPQPDTYGGTYWASTDPGDLDNGGVHINSGIGNFWYYLMCEGGSGTNDNGDAYNVTSIGIEKATNIVFHTFTNYLTSTSDYDDAYHLSMAAVEDLYGEDSEELTTLKAAWFAVGIPTTSSVKNIPAFANDLSFYPNPATELLTVRNDGNEKLMAEILDVTGRSIMTFSINQGSQSISISHLVAGNYMIQFSNANQSFTKKLVKM